MSWTDKDRRRHARFSGKDYPLLVGHCPARLIDWSAGGVCVSLLGGVGTFKPGDVVDIRVASDQILAVAVLIGTIIRTDPSEGAIGIALANEGDAITLLTDLTGP